MILTAFSGIALGTLLGCAILINEPPLRVKDPSAGRANRLGDYTARYAAGAVAASESATIRSRVSRLGRKVPGSIPFTELEINQHLSQFQFSDTDDAGNALNLSLSAPNVRMETDAFVLSSKVVVNPTTDRFELIFQAAGHFENRDDGVAMKIDRLFLNSLQIPGFGGLAENLFHAKASLIPLPPEVQDGWGSVRKVELLKGKIVLVL